MNSEAAARAVIDEVSPRRGGVRVVFHGAHGGANPAGTQRGLEAVTVLATGGGMLIVERKSTLHGSRRLLHLKLETTCPRNSL